MNKKMLKAVEIEDVALFRNLSALTYSPAGKRLAFEVTRADLDKNEYHTDIWVAQEGKARQVTWSLDANIVLWDDEDTLVIRRKLPEGENGVTELFRLSMNGGEAAPWMTLPFGLRQMKKLGDRYIATGSIRAEDPDAYLDTPEKRKEKAEQAKKEADYHVVDEVPYWFNGAGYINGLRNALFLIQEENGKAACRRLTEPKFSVDSLWTDGDTVYYAGAVKQGRESMYNRVYAWNAETKKRETLWGRTGYAFGELFTLKGKLYARASDMKTYGVNQTSDLVRVEKDRVTTVYVPEVSLYSSVIGDTAEGHGGRGTLAGEGEYLTMATVEDHNAIFSLKPGKNGRMTCRTLWEQPGMVCFMEACAEKIAVVYQPWDRGAELYEMTREGTEMTRLTGINEDALAGRYVAEPKRVDYTSCGMALHGWALLPQDFSPKKKYPAVLDVHGGPRAVYGETFFHEMQVWVSRGFVVFFTNIKGSDGRGDAFADIRGDYGGTDFQNLMDFTDAVLKAYPNIDKKRLCETGGSYGGFMTNWIIGHTDRFCCAASQRSIANWISMSFISDIGPYFGPDQCGGKGLFGDENTKALWDHSPLKYAKQVKTPTLFIHSEEDYRCPLPEGMQMMQALAVNGVETRMVIFKGENHELSRSGKPQHRVRRLKEITEWFEKHTGSKTKKA